MTNDLADDPLLRNDVKRVDVRVFCDVQLFALADRHTQLRRLWGQS